MPILRGAVTFARFTAQHQAEAPRDQRHWLQRGLKAKAFEPLKPDEAEDRAAGFVEVENPERTDFGPGDLFQGERALFAYRVETFKVPANALRTELERWQQGYQKEHGRAPRRTEKAEAKEALKKKLRSKLEPTVRVFDVSWNLRSGQLLVWATSRKVLEEITGHLEERLKVRIDGRIPMAAAQRAKADVDALGPTLELFGAELAGLEVRDGQA